MRMSASAVVTGAWGGDLARKQSSIAAARAALATDPVVTLDPTLRLVPHGGAHDASNVYCAAYGTDDPAELEARAGLPVSTLMLASAALCACQYMGHPVEGGGTRFRLVESAAEAPLAALEAIPVGADPVTLARNYLVDLLGLVAEFRGRDGRTLTSDQQAIVHELAARHRECCTDPAMFRALRRAAMAAADAAAGSLEATAMLFVESVAWPTAGLRSELPVIVSILHVDFRACLEPEVPSVAEQATLGALADLYLAHRKKLNERLKLEPTLDVKAERARIDALLETTPEFAAVNTPAFQARLVHYQRVAAEAYAPFAVDVLLGAFRKA